MQRRLNGARRIAVIGIGDECLIPDRLGMLAAREIDGLHLPGVRVFLAGTVPESITGPIRACHPDHVVLFDAADMRALPGNLAIVEPGEIQATLFSTHVLPLSAVMEFIAEDTGARVTFVAIQPDLAHLGETPTSEELAGVTRLSEAFYHESLHRTQITTETKTISDSP